MIPNSLYISEFLRPLSRRNSSIMSHVSCSAASLCSAASCRFQLQQGLMSFTFQSNSFPRYFSVTCPFHPWFSTLNGKGLFFTYQETNTQTKDSTHFSRIRRAVRGPTSVAFSTIASVRSTVFCPAVTSTQRYNLEALEHFNFEKL